MIVNYILVLFYKIRQFIDLFPSTNTNDVRVTSPFSNSVARPVQALRGGSMASVVNLFMAFLLTYGSYWVQLLVCTRWELIQSLLHSSASVFVCWPDNLEFYCEEQLFILLFLLLNCCTINVSALHSCKFR